MATARVPLALTVPSDDGNAYPYVLASTTRQMYFALDFAADGRWHFRGMVPENYSSTPSIVVVYCANNTTASREARIAVEAAAIADAEDQDPTLSTVETLDVTAPTTAYLQDRATFDASMPTLAAGDVLIGAVYRDADHANDDLAVDFLIAEVYLEYTTT